MRLAPIPAKLLHGPSGSTQHVLDDLRVVRDLWDAEIDQPRPERADFFDQVEAVDPSRLVRELGDPVDRGVHDDNLRIGPREDVLVYEYVEKQ